MAPLSKALFLAAIVVIAMAVLSPSPVHGKKKKPLCFPLPGCTDIMSGGRLRGYIACLAAGYPVANCYSIPPSTKQDNCCCLS
ncbi:unnamed protein product [Urochloa decumbens]|uniref:Uncharacterized protein n=1 Tax=Urochloa decumbens TaxID=240449 RepID=A0ABC9B8P8_9POAL